MSSSRLLSLPPKVIELIGSYVVSCTYIFGDDEKPKPHSGCRTGNVWFTICKKLRDESDKIRQKELHFQFLSKNIGRAHKMLGNSLCPRNLSMVSHIDLKIGRGMPILASDAISRQEYQNMIDGLPGLRQSMYTTKLHGEILRLSRQL
jgi:hypothetical protein